jgi:hypothetical protein
VSFPPLTNYQNQSLYDQLACHARWARQPIGSGPTWDFEAWRKTGASLLNKCSPGRAVFPEPTVPPPSTPAPVEPLPQPDLPTLPTISPVPVATPTPAPAPAPVPVPTWSEQESPNHPVNTFTNPNNASGMGPSIAAGQWVQVSCKVYAPYIASVNPDGYWYRIAASPWDNAYYAPANTFMNGDPYGGPYTHNTDFAVPNC